MAFKYIDIKTVKFFMNSVQELEKILRPTKTHVEETEHENDSVLETKEYSVLPFGGDSYAEF